jgi:hypothetical protein
MKALLAVAFFVLASSSLSISALAQIPRQGVEEPVFPSPMDRYPPLVLPRLATSRGGEGPYIPREDRVLKKGLLAPSNGDRLAFASFLRTRNTGLIRLLPREIYDNPSHKKGERAIRGGGAYYWFAKLTHAYGYGSDIGLQRNQLSVGFAGLDYGMLTNLGDVSLEDISLEDWRAEFISEYEPARSERQARAEAGRFSAIRARAEHGRTAINSGVTVNGMVYSRSLPVEENNSYLLRSIVYDRSDVLVAFRVVRKDSDGSVIIAWKLLKEYSAPRLSK